MKQWTTPQLFGASSGSEAKIPVGFEFFVFGEEHDPDPDPEGDS